METNLLVQMLVLLLQLQIGVHLSSLHIYPLCPSIILKTHFALMFKFHLCHNLEGVCITEIKLGVVYSLDER